MCIRIQLRWKVRKKNKRDKKYFKIKRKIFL